MKKVLMIMVAIASTIVASAQQKDSFLSHMYLPVDAGASFSTLEGVGGAFYMRASLEYRFNIHKGLFIVGELDTRTHPYTNKAITTGNVVAGDAAFTDILIGPGYRAMLSDSFKLAFALQGGVTNMAYKEVKPAVGASISALDARYELLPREQWTACAKASLMAEYYLNPSFDIFLNLGLPATFVPHEIASATYSAFVLFPTVSIGFSMALE
ncbi:MAG: hypothetical protein II475_04505 [Bacteroidales bacterium]|nr:hypothetical protein [Bacteroidales bacterium]MBQ3942250.1 hypothetical protein [Bacteroidales bacterium]